MFKRLFTSALVFGLAATAPPVLAQASCAPRDRVIERLETGFAETIAGVGLQSPESLVEIWSSEKTGSWTILTTRPDGLSCIVAHGNNWMDLRDAPEALGVKVGTDAK